MKKLWLLLIWQAFACISVLGQQNTPAPARVLTSYALTSVPDYWYLFPSAWHLLASNDGQTWTELDFRTNQPAVNASTRRVYQISNQKAFRIYRLQVDANGTKSPSKVGVAEFELIGPVVGVTNEADLQAKITSSQEHPVLGAAVNAFDGDTATRWLDFAPFEGGNCWIQCEYVPQSEFLMTNADQVRMGNLLTAIPSMLLEKSSQIMSNLTMAAAQPVRTLTGYALTSGNDLPARDPSDWRLVGSNDGGNTWETVDVRRDEIFSTRLHRRVFVLAQPAHFLLYRLLIQARVQGDSMQLAELEPLYADQQKTARFSMVVAASGENPPMEKTEMAFDHDSRSKWLCFTDTTNQMVWIQWQCLPEVEGLPLINLDQLTAMVNRGKKMSPIPPPSKLARTLTGYTLVSANDLPARDPVSWHLLGSNDAGKNWETVDTRRDEKFPDRFRGLTFTVANPKAYAEYRLMFDSVITPTNATSIQLADIEPVYAAAGTNDDYSLVVSSRGDNPPLEGVEKLFDGDPQTKWLDFSEDARRASWVQWYFVPKEKLPVVRADSVHAVQPGLPLVKKVCMEGVVVCENASLLGLLDDSGLQMFQLDAAVAEVKPGDRVRLSGRVRFGKEFPLVQNPDLFKLGPLANVTEIDAEHDYDTKPPLILGTAGGKVTAVSEGQLYSTIRLLPDHGTHSVTVKILNLQHRPLPVMADHHIRVRGVVEPVYDEHGRQFEGMVWVAGLDDVTVMPLAEAARPTIRLQETNELTTIHQIIDACKNEPDKVFTVKVNGVITFVDLGLEGWYLQSGPDAVFVQEQMGSGVNPYLKQEGSYVEVQGIVGGTNGLDIAPTAFIKILGKGRMPEPLRPSMDTLVAGNCDGKWVQLDGIVAAFEKQRLTLRTPGGRLIVWVNDDEWKGQDRLLGSFVRISGVCAPVVNNHLQRFGVRLLVPSADWVEMIEPSPEKPFDLPTRTIGSLLQGMPRSTGIRTQLRKITGVVIYKEPQMLFVQNDSEGVRVFPRDDAVVAPGDQVEVVGMAEPDGLTPKLVQALIKKTGEAALPAANPIDVQGMTLDDEVSQDATRGSVDATLLGVSENGSVQILELQQDKTKIPFRAYLPEDGGRITSLPEGSRVRLEGAFKAKSDTVPDFGQVLSSFEMYLNSSADIVVLERPSWWTSQHTLWLLGGLGIILFGASTWIGSLRVQVTRRTGELHKVIGEHEVTEAQLQAEISERKRMEIEVQKTHKELLTTSRQAGMAEVATSVLHNVGNVLNSVNVSSSIVADNLRKSSGANLAKVVALMDEHATDIGSFMATDDKGRMIPSYLAKLAKQMDKERTATLGEVDGLRQNIEHIKEIVAVQQTYARVAGVTETISVAELVDDALRMNSTSLTRHDIKVIREYDPQLSQITVDKHKVLQILVNVFRNAKYACDATGRQDKQIHLHLRKNGSGVVIAITDNGVGISPENLTKIFNHGFTTRKDGHGFGLHSGALAAKEMGGALTVASKGQGQGATFTLELPLQPPKTNA